METIEDGQENKEKFYDHFEFPIQDPVRIRNQDKIAKIIEACKGKDLKALRELATSVSGLVLDSNRSIAWPFLLGIGQNYSDYSDYPGKNLESSNWEDLPEHPDEDQVKLDVNRSFIYYPHGQSSNDMLLLRERLLQLIVDFLRHHPKFSYFQGFHDICQVFMLVLNPESFQPAITRLSILRIRDFMLPTFSQALSQLHLIPSIINRVDPKLSQHLSSTQPHFALSSILTMFAHDVQEYNNITRIIDVLLARETVFSIYMISQIVLQRSDELFQISSDEPEILHSILLKIPRPLEVETLIANTVKLYELHPPEVLKEWKCISRNSVMKTTRWPDRLAEQSIHDGYQFFFNQVRELKLADQRNKLLKKLHAYWKPVLKVGFPVLIGITIFWYQSSGISELFKDWVVFKRFLVGLG